MATYSNKLFVFEMILTDYNSGMCLIVATSVDHADELYFERFNHNRPAHDFDNSYYELAEPLPVGVREYVYGGG